MIAVKTINMRFISVVVVFMFVLIVLSIPISASSVKLIENSTWGADLNPVSWSSIALGDIDNDDDLDLVVTGCSNGGVQSCNTVDNARVYTNNGTSLIESPMWQQNLTGVGWSSIALGDIDNDGDLDLVISGDTGGKNGIVKVYTNNGTSFLENSTWQQNLTDVDVYSGAVALGDIDNDGDLDLGLIGAGASAKNGIYTNNGTSFVKNLAWIQSLPRVGHGDDHGAHIAFGDINNDGRLDMLMVGSYNVDFYRGAYINNGTSLVENSTWEQGFNAIFGESEHSIALHDWNNDGLLDFSCIGLRAGDHFYIYQNIGTRFTVNSTEDSPSNACFPGVYDGATSWGDYDNDGDLDVVLIGMEVGRARVIEQGIANPWNCTFAKDDTAHSNISNKIVRGSMAWADIDEDDDLDLIMTGDDDTTEIAEVYINNGTIKNTKPNSTNSDFSSTFNFSKGELILTWGNGSDNETPTLGLYYNLRVGTCSGCHDVVSGVYGGGDVNGYFGNMMQRKSITLNRPDLENQTIYWAVQTIDTGLAKSEWSTEQVYKIVKAPPQCVENWTYGSWSSCVSGQQTRSATDLNNCGTEVNKSATIQECDDEGGNGGSSNGGSSGTIIPPADDKPKRPENVTGYFEKIEPGVDTGVSVDEEGLSIRQVWVKVKNELREVSVNIKQLGNKPTFVSEVPEGKVYQYVNITYFNLPDEEVEAGKINFKVDKGWIEGNSINESSVRLMRYYYENWQKLDTTIEEEDSVFVYYQAEVSGFSIFAITGEILKEVGMSCIPLELRCEGNELQECSIDGTELIVKEVCEYGCENGKCKEKPSEFGPVFLWPTLTLMLIVFIVAGIILHKKRSVSPRSSFS